MILPLLLCKVVIGLAAGMLVDAFLRKRGRKRELHDLCEHCGCTEESGIWKPALWHTVHIFLFILALNVALNLAIALLGQDRIAALLLSGSVLQPFVAALILCVKKHGFLPCFCIVQRGSSCSAKPQKAETR